MELSRNRRRLVLPRTKAVAKSGKAAKADSCGSSAIAGSGKDGPSSSKRGRTRLRDATLLSGSLVTPGDLILRDGRGFLRGRGVAEEVVVAGSAPSSSSSSSKDGPTSAENQGQATATTTTSTTVRFRATILGRVRMLDKLVFVQPSSLSSTYFPEIGDVVVGRVADVGPARWAVQLGSARPAALHLAAINLPGNVQRRRTAEDALQIRGFFQEGDLLCAEVLTRGKGEFAAEQEPTLQTRSAKYGKLQNGVLTAVPPSLVLREGQHIATLESLDVSVVLGCNGWVWVHERARGGGGIETLNYSGVSVGDATSKAPLSADVVSRVHQARSVVDLFSALALEISVARLDAACAWWMADCKSKGVAPEAGGLQDLAQALLNGEERGQRVSSADTYVVFALASGLRAITVREEVTASTQSV